MQTSDSGRDKAAGLSVTRRSSTPGLLLLFARASHWLHRLTQVVAGAILVVLVVTVFIAVVFRYVLNSPLTWTDELAVSLAVWLTFLGAAIAMTDGRHFGFDALVERMPFGLRRTVGWVTTIGGAIFLLVMIANGAQVLPILANQKTPSLQISVSWVYAGLPVGCALILIQMLARLLNPSALPEEAQSGKEEAV